MQSLSVIVRLNRSLITAQIATGVLRTAIQSIREQLGLIVIDHTHDVERSIRRGLRDILVNNTPADCLHVV